jgi:DNA topoisomerase IB
MLEAFADLHTSMAYVNVGKRIVLYTVSLLSRESLDLLLRRGLRRPNFLLRSVRFSLVWGLNVSRRSRGNRNVIEEDRRAGPTTKRERHVGTLGSIHLDTPTPTPALDTGKMVLKDL